MTARYAARSLQRCWAALASGFVTAELHHQAGHDQRGALKQALQRRR